MISSSPAVSLASMSSSPSSIMMAMMPPFRTFLKSDRLVFFVMPLRVANTILCAGSQVSSSRPEPLLGMRIMAAIFSSARSSSHVREGATLRVARALRHLVDALQIHAPVAGEEQQVVVRARREEMLDEVTRVGLGAVALAHGDAGHSLAAATLRAPLGGIGALDVAAVRDGEQAGLIPGSDPRWRCRRRRARSPCGAGGRAWP